MKDSEMNAFIGQLANMRIDIVIMTLLSTSLSFKIAYYMQKYSKFSAMGIYIMLFLKYYGIVGSPMVWVAIVYGIMCFVCVEIVARRVSKELKQ